MMGPVEIIGGRRVITSGVIIARMGERIEIHPFGLNARAKIWFQYKFVEEGNKTFSEYDGEWRIVRIEKQWMLDNETSQAGDIEVAYGDPPGSKYYFRYVFRTTGPASDFTVELQYSILIVEA